MQMPAKERKIINSAPGSHLVNSFIQANTFVYKEIESSNPSSKQLR